MKLTELEVELPDDVMASLRDAVRHGHSASVDEAVVVAVYWQAEEFVRVGNGTGMARKVLEMPLERTLLEFRQALAEKHRCQSTQHC